MPQAVHKTFMHNRAGRGRVGRRGKARERSGGAGSACRRAVTQRAAVAHCGERHATSGWAAGLGTKE
eukprot:37504-Chlamydomonas_euryale.AAC.6